MDLTNSYNTSIIGPGQHADTLVLLDTRLYSVTLKKKDWIASSLNKRIQIGGTVFLIISVSLDRQTRAYIYAVSVILIWATVASVFKLSLRYVDYLQLLLYSTAVSLFILFVLLIAQKKIYLLKTYSGKQYIQSLLMGILNPFLYYMVLFKAYSLLPAQQAQPLNYTWPIMVVVLSLLVLHQRIRILNILAVVISFCGVLVITTQGDIQNFHIENLWGIILALGSAFIWALFWILNLWDKRDNVVKLFLNFSFGFIFILLVTPLLSSLPPPPLYGLVGIAYIGVFEMGISFVIWMKALSLSHTTAQVSNLIYISPFVSLVFIHFFVGEIIQASTVLGLCIIVLGILMQYYASHRYIFS